MKTNKGFNKEKGREFRLKSGRNANRVWAFLLVVIFIFSGAAPSYPSRSLPKGVKSAII